MIDASRTTLLLLAAALAIGCGSHRRAEPQAAPAPPEIADGRTLYRQNCGACHGLAGKGDGIVSSLMTPKPTDLTRLSAANEGEFPAEALRRFIDGRATIRAHGNSEMPVWGATFTIRSDVGAEQVDATITAIVDYLASIQVP